MIAKAAARFAVPVAALSHTLATMGVELWRIWRQCERLELHCVISVRSGRIWTDQRVKVLHICSRLPWPPNEGTRICMYRTVEALAALGHAIHLVAFDEEQSDPGPLARMANVVVVPLQRRPAAVGALSTLANRRPYTQLKREVLSAYGLLDRLHSAQHFDVVLADEIHVAPYGAHMKRRHGVPYVLRTHNIQHEIYQHHTETVRKPLTRAYFTLQTGRWRRFEFEQFAVADVLAAITFQDLKVIERMMPGRLVRSIPAAVDLASFPYCGTISRERHSMLMLGDMRWPPNRDAAIWFTRDILPHVVSKVRDAKLYLIGNAPPTARLPAPSENLEIKGRGTGRRAVLRACHARRHPASSGRRNASEDD